VATCVRSNKLRTFVHADDVYLQEKSYNPYYTLTAQHLCRTSHSYKVTLQFCLWDFLRDLGETTVGGAEVIKNLKEDDGFDAKNISAARMANIAKAYGWWIAKDCCTLAILKVSGWFLVFHLAVISQDPFFK